MAVVRRVAKMLEVMVAAERAEVMAVVTVAVGRVVAVVEVMVPLGLNSTKLQVAC